MDVDFFTGRMAWFPQNCRWEIRPPEIVEALIARFRGTVAVAHREGLVGPDRQEWARALMDRAATAALRSGSVLDPIPLLTLTRPNEMAGDDAPWLATWREVVDMVEPDQPLPYFAVLDDDCYPWLALDVCLAEGDFDAVLRCLMVANRLLYMERTGTALRSNDQLLWSTGVLALLPCGSDDPDDIGSALGRLLTAVERRFGATSRSLDCNIRPDILIGPVALVPGEWVRSGRGARCWVPVAILFDLTRRVGSALIAVPGASAD